MTWRVVAGQAVAVVLVLSACNRSTQPRVSGQALADSAQQVMFDVHSLLTEHGVKRGDLFADTVYVFNDQTHFVLRKVRTKFNTETGIPNGSLNGERRVYDLHTGILEGFGNVIVESTDGRKLTSNQLKYSQSANEVSSDSAFTMVGQGRVQRGIGFTSDPNMKAFRCHAACTGSADVQIRSVTP
jgi:LPS export ABC transporter protein LptC